MGEKEPVTFVVVLSEFSEESQEVISSSPKYFYFIYHYQQWLNFEVTPSIINVISATYNYYK